MIEINEEPLMVTVKCITYNQENYIRQCLEGIVMQQTNFRFEVIVHDDASTDKTPIIIREFEKNYPDIIKPIYETENQHSKHDGSIRRILKEHTRGVYSALCEGDDYWTDPLKLQKQFDFMEAHPECNLCYHSNYDLKPNGEMVLRDVGGETDTYTVDDILVRLADGRGFGTTASTFYRSKFQHEKRPDFTKRIKVGDLNVLLLNAAKGPVGYLHEPMSVYRITSVGSWATRHVKETFSSQRKRHMDRIAYYDKYDEYTDYRYHKSVQYVKRKIKMLYWKRFIRKVYKKVISVFGKDC